MVGRTALLGLAASPAACANPMTGKRCACDEPGT